MQGNLVFTHAKLFHGQNLQEKAIGANSYPTFNFNSK